MRPQPDPKSTTVAVGRRRGLRSRPGRQGRNARSARPRAGPPPAGGRRSWPASGRPGRPGTRRRRPRGRSGCARAASATPRRSSGPTASGARIFVTGPSSLCAGSPASGWPGLPAGGDRVRSTPARRAVPRGRPAAAPVRRRVVAPAVPAATRTESRRPATTSSSCWTWLSRSAISRALETLRSS